MGPFPFAPACALATSCFLYVNAAGASPCLNIESPVEGAVVSSPVCTVAVSACDQISSVNFVAHFGSPDVKGDTVLLLGHIIHPPFRLLWNTSEIPNQLYRGMSFSAVATLRTGERQSQWVGGVFIANKPFASPVASIPFAANTGFPLFSRAISSGRTPIEVKVSACRTRDGVKFFAVVAAPAVFSSAGKERLREAGMEICIDPGLSRKPYPPYDAFSLAIPLEGAPFKTRYRPVSGPNGSFDVTASKEACTCVYEINKKDDKGFDITATVPASLFGPQIPDSFGCNVIVRLPGDSNQAVRVSWTDAPPGMTFSPFYWGTVLVLPRPLSGAPRVLWLLSFGAGLVLALLTGTIFLLFRKRSVSIEKFEQSEEEKELSDQIYQFIDESVTRNDLTLHWVAEKLGLAPRKVESVIRKHKGKTFRDFIMFLRIEIARERLRSSHSSEPSIAESCGFKTVGEMKKFFAKFYRTTPAKFRKENQVA